MTCCAWAGSCRGCASSSKNGVEWPRRVDDIHPVDLQEPLEELARDPRRFSHDLKFPPAEKIRVYDDTLRDGEQMPGVAITPKDKYELARMLSDIGVHVMDVGFPSVSEAERETLRLVLAGRKRGELRPDLEVVCMMRSTRGDIDATMRVIDALGYARDEVTYFIFTSASDLHVKYKLGKTLLHRDGIPDSEWLELPVSYYREANLRMMCEAIGYAREQGATSIEFGGEDGSRADVDYIAEIHREGLKAGGTRPSQPTEPGIGLNGSSHESGIHTAGMLIHPAIYQFLPPADLGAEISYVYGKHSGALVIEHALRHAGMRPEPELVARVLAEVKRVREERAERSDFSEFHRQYYDHLNRMGLTADEVVDIAKALTA